MFVRAKRHAGRTYYQMVESQRDNGKVRQKVLLHLGPYTTPTEAVTEYQASARRARGRSERFHNYALEAKAIIDEHHAKYQPQRLGQEIPRPVPWITRRTGIDSFIRQYWRRQDIAERQQRWAVNCERRAALIEGWCSAHDWCASVTIVGTTKVAA